MAAGAGASAQLASTLEDAAAQVATIIDRAEWLLDPQSEDAKTAAKGARTFVKLFFDACQARSHPSVRKAADGLNSLVVDGFDREQIWEEMEVQNVPLRRHLRRHIAKLAEAPKGTIELSLSAPSPASASNARVPRAAAEEDDDDEAAGFDDEAASDQPQKSSRKKTAEKGGGKKSAKKAAKKASGADAEAGDADAADGAQDFFDIDEMLKFADMADTGKMRLDEDAGDSDFDLLEAGEDDDDEDAANMKFSDFFAAPEKGDAGGKARRRGSAGGDEGDEEDGDLDADDGEGEEEEFQMEGEEEEGMEEDDLEDLSDEEKELEAKIRALQAQGKEDGDEDDDEDGDVTGAENGEDGDEDDEEGGTKRGKSLYEMDKRLQALEEEVSKLEEEQMQEKTWEMKGEVSARQRPLNSLLEVDLDQPMTSFAARRAEDVAGGAEGQDDEALEDAPGAESLVKSSKFDVDAMIRQRVWDEAFDDVVRKTQLPPSQRPQGAEEDTVETLNFEKSRIGLGDVYAKQYEAELLGHKTDAEKETDKEKAEAKKLFAKLMYKLDLLSNAHFTPRPAMLGISHDQLKVPSLKMEETIPLMVSDATLQAPEERKAPRRHVKDHAELNHEEKVAARRASKAARKKALHRKVEGGEMSLADKREREKRLQEKNKAAKEEKASRGEVKDKAKRVKASEMFEQAAQNAKSDVSRKEEVRKERESRPANTPASKRLKL
eukprot:gb/GFBE01003004.1/.p1 GENE.gb/GFBE01003004.1/~~gb/GFBE01003004.1/.p1  ORF type:complete len:720 (+),score=276.93 gb/GFBE01003004.1/:1-2160(+)